MSTAEGASHSEPNVEQTEGAKVFEQLLDLHSDEKYRGFLSLLRHENRIDVRWSLLGNIEGPDVLNPLLSP